MLCLFVSIPHLLFLLLLLPGAGGIRALFVC